MRMSAQEAALHFVRQRFPDCRVAILSGSAAAGMETERSDLDLVIVDDSQHRPFRASFKEFGWPVEVFVMTSDTAEFLFEMNAASANPSLQRMVASGIVIRDDGTAGELIGRAKEMLDLGPEAWTEEERNEARYTITELLEDLAGSASREEDLFTVNRLAGLLAEFVTRVRGCWYGEGKWAARSLQACDEDFYRRFLQALELFYRKGEKEALAALADAVLEPYGGRLFEGFMQEG